jgi:hypothetical protein
MKTWVVVFACLAGCGDDSGGPCGSGACPDARIDASVDAATIDGATDAFAQMCAVDNGGCDPRTTCTDVAGGTTCGPCPAGYTGTGRTGCLLPLQCAAAQLNMLVGATTPESVNVAADCSGSPTYCCPAGTAQNPCGPMLFDYAMRAGDDARLVTTIPTGTNTLQATLRARVHSMTNIPFGALGQDCTVAVNSTAGSLVDFQFDIPITDQADSTGQHMLVFGSTNMQRFEDADFTPSGGLVCTTTNFGVATYLNMLVGTFYDGLHTAICGACPCAP